jgi:peptidyl-prolyl cis-trans isomerase B (cyclophilin B)
MHRGGIGRKGIAWASAIAVAFGLGRTSHAQLTPDRTYYGVKRAMPMTVLVPPKADGKPREGEVRIDLFEVDDVDPVATAPVLAGKVDVASLFPVVWSGPNPKVRYAQLVVGGEQVGPPVVLQPLVSPPRAVLVEPRTNAVWWRDPKSNAPSFDARQGELAWSVEPPVYSGVRAYVDQWVEVETSLGTITFRLRPDVAPNTAWNFRELVRGGFYTDQIVPRVVNRTPSGAPFVIQLGDPTGTRQGGPGYTIDLEPSTLAHDFGVLSMARAEDPNTGGSQVFVALSRDGTKALDGKYASFGQAVAGAEAIVAISRVEVTGDRPNDPPLVVEARLVDAPAYSKTPSPAKRPEEKPGKR